MTATYLINRMPSRVIGMKSPCEMLLGENKFLVSPKLFGCTCFVRDHRPSVGKLDPRAIKCIFIGYPAGQRGYKCWSPTERRTFVSMDVTFRESEPLYGEKIDLSMLFEDLDPPKSIEDGQKGENTSNVGEEEQQRMPIVGSIPAVVDEEIKSNAQRWPKPNEENNPQVYTRREKFVEQQVVEKQQGEGNQLQGEQPEQNQVVEKEQGEGNQLQGEAEQNQEPRTSSRVGQILSNISASGELPIALRKERRGAGREPPDMYGFKHDISNYVSYDALSPSYKAFVASLQTVAIPRHWKEAKQDPRWREAMMEELEALRKNKTWELAYLPEGKKAITCKWIFTVKQNPEGKIERYKAKLVARGYSHTYGIDYDETFAPVKK